MVLAIKLHTNGFPSYMLAGGMQATGDLLVLGTEARSPIPLHDDS